jgi:hypothetical protein
MFDNSGGRFASFLCNGRQYGTFTVKVGYRSLGEKVRPISAGMALLSDWERMFAGCDILRPEQRGARRFPIPLPAPILKAQPLSFHP